MSEIAVLTRVKKKKGEALRKFLRGLPRELFTDLSDRTHLARLVVIELRRGPHLLFTSRFDGPAEDYVGSLVRDPRALEIWRYCVEPKTVSEASLIAHLLKPENQVPASYVIALAKPHPTVKQINAALELQARLSEFALEAQRMSAVQFAQEFWELEAVREVLEL
ncbi:MAG TPA: hypothetical protein VNZ05_06035 [Solirubrobacteraceae bacterium]|nr:hypothetical protein [Solirubrobacteraceae bacterium]